MIGKGIIGYLSVGENYLRIHKVKCVTRNAVFWVLDNMRQNLEFRMKAPCNEKKGAGQVCKKNQHTDKLVQGFRQPLSSRPTSKCKSTCVVAVCHECTVSLDP